MPEMVFTCPKTPYRWAIETIKEKRSEKLLEIHKKANDYRDEVVNNLSCLYNEMDTLLRGIRNVERLREIFPEGEEIYGNIIKDIMPKNQIAASVKSIKDILNKIG